MEKIGERSREGQKGVEEFPFTSTAFLPEFKEFKWAGI